MAVWRRKAIEAFPDLRAQFEARSCTVYDVFFELLDRVRAAHRADDRDALTRIYGFAQWCLAQADSRLANAAAVAFYEHLFDEPDLREAAVGWLSAEVVASCEPLWRHRLEPDEFAGAWASLMQRPPKAPRSPRRVPR